MDLSDFNILPGLYQKELNDITENKRNWQILADERLLNESNLTVSSKLIIYSDPMYQSIIQ